MSIYEIKAKARRLETIKDILRSLSLGLSLLQGLNLPIRRSGNRGVKRLQDYISYNFPEVANNALALYLARIPESKWVL